MTPNDFVSRFDHAFACAEAMLLAEGTVRPLFMIVNRRGRAHLVAADFTSEIAKEASFGVVRMMCVAEAATAVFHCSEAWAAQGDVASDVKPSEDGRRIEILLVAGTARVDGGLTQRLRVREIRRSLLGDVSGVRDVAVSALGGEDIQHLPVQGRLTELLPAAAPTFADRWRARGRVIQATRHLTRWRPTCAR